jgi:hypothetical protein
MLNAHKGARAGRHFTGGNPFGHSSTNLGSLYKGMARDMFQNFKHLRTRHARLRRKSPRLRVQFGQRFLRTYLI